MQIRTSVVRALATTVALTTLAGQDFSYRLRSNRMEGLRDIPTAGHALTLLSFTVQQAPSGWDAYPNLRVRFFLAELADVYLTAVELRRHGRSHYQMRPVRTRWNAGWQEFSPWPSTEVLAPLNIPINNVGIVARLHEDQPGSGTIAPVLLLAGNRASVPLRYTVHFLPRNTLSRIDYTLDDVDARRRILVDRIPHAAANIPFEIQLDLENKPSGNYRLVVSTREYGRTTGPSHQYFFRHQREK